jgi:hypothetical protein
MSGKAEKSKHQIARKHHFVSEGYLAAFTNTGTSKGVLCAYDHSTQTFFKSKPKHVAFEVDYNRVSIPNYPPDALETGLGQFESHAIRDLRKIITTGKLTSPEEFRWVYNLIAMFAVKTPAIRSASDAAQQRIMRQLMRLTVSSKQMYESQISAARESGFLRPGLDVSYEKAKEFVMRGEYTISIPVERHIITEHSVFDKILPHLSQRYWSVMTATVDAPDIITCDRPAPPMLGAERVIFPISSRRALLGTKEAEAPEEFEIDTEKVAYLNFKMLSQSMKQIYSRSSEITLLHEDKPMTVDISRLRSSR